MMQVSNSSCQELLRASRPGFPEGLKVLVVMKDIGLHASAKKVLEEVGYKVTVVATLDKGLSTLEAAAAAEAAATQFDVALIEARQTEPLLASAEGAGNNGAAATSTAAKGDAATSALFARFTRMAAEVAIVLMHEEEDVSSKSYMIEAIKVGVVDVVKFPLAKQSMRTLWQHAVRKMIRQQGGIQVGGGMVLGNKLGGTGAGGKRSASVNDGLRLQAAAATRGNGSNAHASNSSDSSASEERAVKRQTNSSPTTVLGQEGNAESSGAGAAAAAGGAGAGGGGGAKGSAKGGGGAGGSFAKGGGSKKGDDETATTTGAGATKKGGAAGGGGGGAGAGNGGGGAAKQKPQARSTQQWKAAEQRGRRLAIKPHTAVQAQNPANGQVVGRMQGMGYWQPAPGQQGAMMGQTQTMTINGQQVQVWVPMNGMYQHPQQQQGQQQQQQQQGQQQNGQQPGQQQSGGQQADQSNAAVNENNNNAATATANATAANNGNTTTNANGQQQQQQPYMYSPGGMITAVGPNGQPMHMAPMNGQQMGYGQMVLVQQQNGQQMYVQAAPGMHQMVNGQMVMNAGQQGQWVQGGQQQQQQQHGGYYQQMPGGDASQQQVGQQQGNDGKGGQQVGQQQQQGGFYGAAQNGGAGMPQQMQPQPMPQLDPMDQLKSQPLPLGLNLKRTNSLQNIMGGSLADVIGSPSGGGALEPISTSMFNDVEMLEEDALDAILTQAKDGNLLSFDGMDEAMLEAAAASGSAAGDLGLVRA